MNFQSLQKVEGPDFYLDVSIKAGKRAVVKAASKVRGEKLERMKVVESERVRVVGRNLHGMLSSIFESFPDIDNLPDFYRELVRVLVDRDSLKRSLAAVRWADRQCLRFGRIYYGKIRASRDVKSVLLHKKAFFGRVSSAVKQVKLEFAIIEEARRVMKRFPAVKTDLETVVIAGFPNVGKTTLLKAITGADPKIAPYPFTTQGLMFGYLSGKRKVQFIDTPGLLDRPLNRRNRIELQSILALKHLAGSMIFVIDPSGSSGYGFDEQLGLLRDVSSAFRLRTVVALNKVDLVDREEVSMLRSLLDEFVVLEISAEKGAGVKELIDAVVKDA
ncbi:50S ribosome-binding GTPase [Candidatus Woesearchaeota archaeon]|nr:50S ribosome-binding GTPase [Candidatus Woesearchaeota archaeon]